MALQLFMCSVRPLLDTLTTWLRQGTLHDPVGHVFITAGVYLCVVVMPWPGSITRHHALMHLHTFNTDASVCVDSDTFWSSAFTERLAHGGEGPAAPLFLLPLVERVINAGKAMILLRNEGVRHWQAEWKGGSVKQQCEAVVFSNSVKQQCEATV